MNEMLHSTSLMQVVLHKFQLFEEGKLFFVEALFCTLNFCSKILFVDVFSLNPSYQTDLGW